jgi:hypothetical protein
VEIAVPKTSFKRGAEPGRRIPSGIISFFCTPSDMEAERLNAIASRLADLKGRELELRRYL